MAQLSVQKVEEALKAEGFSAADTQKVRGAIMAHLPAKTYNTAILFLGWATVALAVGSIVLAGVGNAVPEALWGALGAGIGGLAGIFMSKE